MKKTSLAELESRFARREVLIVPWLIGAIAAIAVPFIALTIGWLIELLIRMSVTKSLPDTIYLSPHLSLSAKWLEVDRGPLRGVLALIAIAFGLAFLEAMALHALYRWAIHFALNGEVWLRRRMYEVNQVMAARHGIVARRGTQMEAMQHWIPQIRDGLMAWYRTVPRHLMQAVACFSFALLIHPLLMVLAAVALVLLWRIFATIEGRLRRLRPVLTERIHAAQSQLSDLDECGPLTSLVHSHAMVDQTFESQLRLLRDTEFRLIASSQWKAPFLVSLIAVFVGVFCLALSIRILQDHSQLGVAGAITMLALIGVGYVSLVKVRRAWGASLYADRAAAQTLAVLNQAADEALPLTDATAPRLQKELVLSRVTLHDSVGVKIVEEVSFQASPGMLVALVSTSGDEAQAVGEMMLGFGVPSVGLVLWDGIPTKRLSRAFFRERCAWVAADGPMISGTLIDNLTSSEKPHSMAEVIDAVKLAGAYEAVSSLQDALSTMITPQDDRLKNDVLFQLGLARAILGQPSVVVAVEPREPVTAAAENRSLDGMRHLTEQGAIVFVISQRANTLRQADRVVLFHEHRLAAIGTHAELLGQSELYRHLNYVRFSPLKDVRVG